MIPSLKSIFNFNQWKQVQQWVNNKLTLKQDIFNANNTATGTTSVTINAKSGVATFTSIIPAGSGAIFIINNNQVTVNSLVFFSIKNSSDGEPYISYYNTGSGTISIAVPNPSGDATSDPLQIAFQILN